MNRAYGTSTSRSVERWRSTRGLFVLLLIVAGISVPAHSSIPEDAVLWTARYHGSAGLDDQTAALALSPDDSVVFVTGLTGLTFEEGANSDYATLAYSAASGAQIWASLYNGPADANDVGNALAVSPDGTKVFVTGASAGSGGNTDYATVAYSAASGAQLWVARYNGPANLDDGASAVDVSPDGSKVFVTGTSADSGSDYATVAYSAASGSELWSARYSGPGSSDLFASSLEVSPDGAKVFVSGIDYRRPGNSAIVAYSSASGVELWSTSMNGSGGSLAVSPDGSKIFVVGSLVDTPGSAVAAYSATNGVELWAEYYNGSATSLAVSPSGTRVFVTGWGASAGGSLTVSYSSASGLPVWSARYSGPLNANDVATAIAVSPDGSRVFVTGFSSGVGLTDYATVAHAATNGARLWSARYNGPASAFDEANAIAVSSDSSRVFVTGQSAGLSVTYDYATIAYRATSCADALDESGAISSRVHDTVESISELAAPYVHGISCALASQTGL